MKNRKRKHVINQSSFQLLVKEITRKINPKIKFQSLALGILQVTNNFHIFFSLIKFNISLLKCRTLQKVI